MIIVGRLSAITSLGVTATVPEIATIIRAKNQVLTRRNAERAMTCDEYADLSETQDDRADGWRGAHGTLG